MADWRAVMQAHPVVRDYIKNRRWARRGDVVTYAANQENAAFSTDSAGFRHSVFEGQTIGIAQVLNAKRYGLVMGSSHVFGFGLPGNADTLPSQIGAALGMPMGNISFPEADTRTLHAVLTNVLATHPVKPALIVLFTGGDFTRHAFSAEADPVFGSRNVEDARAAEGVDLLAAAAASTPRAIAFSRLWTQAVVSLARLTQVPVVLIDDVTFMEKQTPSASEQTSALGQSGAADQQRRFAHQRRFGASFFEMRRNLAAELGVPIMPMSANDTKFIDEFHYDSGSISQTATIFAPHIKRLLS